MTLEERQALAREMLAIATEARLEGMEFCVRAARDLAEVMAGSAAKAAAEANENAANVFRASSGTLTFYADELASVIAKRRVGR